METKLRTTRALLAILLAFAMFGLSACGCSATQDSVNDDVSSASTQSSSSSDAGQEDADGENAGSTADEQTGSDKQPEAPASSQADASNQQSSVEEPASAPSTIDVSVSIRSSNAGDRSFGTISRRVTLEPGATAYDALVATGVSVGGSSSYVTSINGLAEKSCGPMSGWTYYVNGDLPSKPANRAKLGNGDSVTWVFVTSPDDRL